MEKWEINATKAQRLTKEAPMRKLEQIKRTIAANITACAQDGQNKMVIYMADHTINMLEDWCYLYNWLLKLGFEVDDHSKEGHFIVRW